MARSKVRSGSLTMIVAVTDDAPKGIPLALVENFQYNQPHRTEQHTGVGSVHPDEIVHHGAGAVTISWGAVHTIPAESYQALKILPEHRRLASYSLITLIANDVERGETFAQFTDCAPESFSTTIGAQTSLRQNVSFIGKYVEHASELN